jgi:hypothetical protein
MQFILKGGSETGHLFFVEGVEGIVGVEEVEGVEVVEELCK